jgi:glutamate/tyrosine decarboxylase-like PLP-dependent enzyme
VTGGLAASAGGRFFGWVIGGAVPAALAADWLTSTWDQNAGMYAVAPAAAVVEEVCGRWLLELLRLPRSASFALVTGCQMAHVTCLAAARNAVLARHGWDVEQQGLFGAPAIRVVTGDQRHGTIERALRLLGLGRGSVVDIPVDEKGLTGAALEPVLAAAPMTPTIVLLQAGDLNTGAFDPFQEVIPVAHRHRAWVHVDGAAPLPGVQVLCLPRINQGLLRFLDPRPCATEADHDRRTEEVTARIVASGEALFACTTWRGRRCMRVSVSGWATTDDDVRRTVRSIDAAMRTTTHGPEAVARPRPT